MKNLLLLLGLLLSLPAFGQISLDSGSPQNSGNQTVASYSFNLTIGTGCSNPVAVVGVGVGDAGTPVTVTGITYNSASMTQIRTDTANLSLRSDLWRLINPTHDGAAHSVTVTLAGAPSSGSAAVAYAFCGVNQTTPVDVNNGATGNGATASVSITTNVNNDWYVVAVAAPIGTPVSSFSNGETQDFISGAGTGSGFGHKGPVATGTTTPAAAIGAGGGNWTISVVALQQAATQIGGSTIAGATTLGGASKVQ